MARIGACRYGGSRAGIKTNRRLKAPVVGAIFLFSKGRAVERERRARSRLGRTRPRPCGPSTDRPCGRPKRPIHDLARRSASRLAPNDRPYWRSRAAVRYSWKRNLASRWNYQMPSAPPQAKSSHPPQPSSLSIVPWPYRQPRPGKHLFRPNVSSALTRASRGVLNRSPQAVQHHQEPG